MNALFITALYGLVYGVAPDNEAWLHYLCAREQMANWGRKRVWS